MLAGGPRERSTESYPQGRTVESFNGGSGVLLARGRSEGEPELVDENGAAKAGEAVETPCEKRQCNESDWLLIAARYRDDPQRRRAGQRKTTSSTQWQIRPTMNRLGGEGVSAKTQY